MGTTFLQQNKGGNTVPSLSHRKQTLGLGHNIPMQIGLYKMQQSFGVTFRMNHFRKYKFRILCSLYFELMRLNKIVNHVLIKMKGCPA